MPYVQRRAGVVIAVYGRAQPGIADEELADDHADVVGFFHPPPCPADVRVESARRMAAIVANYTPEERTTWPEQIRQAEAWTAAGGAAVDDDAPMLAVIAQARGMTTGQMVARVHAKRTAYAAAVAPILARQQALEAALEAASTPEERAAIDITAGWPEED